ncbi:MAG: aldo/keto reductase [Erysipelotrichaceae bacterium]|nr:aldo/keto reductase [Erysipelotrichaceae bacterium]
MNQTYVTLNNGLKIPQFGLGVYMIRGDEATKDACLKALELGYRHIDTAHAYQNERGVGAAIKESGINREEVWITSKLWPSEYGEGITMEAIDKMLKRLDTDYIDMLLLHQQFGDYVGAWKDMEKAVEIGKVKTIGISNFESERLEEILEVSTIKPAVLQVECHPYYQQDALKERIQKYGTIIESWYPIGHGDKNLINEPIFTTLAQKYNKTNVQIILRWHIQSGNIIFPKTTNSNHMKDNINIFDFTLTDDEMKQIKSLDKNQRYFTLNLQQQEAQLSGFKPAD